MPGLPDASYTYRRWSASARSRQAATGSSSAGSTTTCAPKAAAIARRAADGSDDDDGMDAALGEGGDRAQTHRAAAGDDRAGRRLDLGAPHAVEPGGHRVDGGGVVRGDAVGDLHVPVRRHHDLLGERAGVVGGVPDAVHDPGGVDDRR